MTSLFRKLRERLPLNLLANFLGTGWSAVLGFVFVPIYIRLLGIEAYGVIGFFTTLQATLQILDLGLSPTMSREMARYSVQPNRASEARDLVRTLEVGYWMIGVLIGILLLSAAGFLAENWLNASKLSPEQLRTATLSIGVLIVLQWPVSFYQSGLMGLQKQILLNSLLIFTTTVRGFGAVIVLSMGSPTLTSFFFWQIGVSLVYTGLLAFSLWRNLPNAETTARVNLSLLASHWRFAAGMSGISVFTLLLTQVDKIILSRLLSLESYGYYTVASMVANGLGLLVTPIFNYIFPRLSILNELQKPNVTRVFFHQSVQATAVIILPIAGLLITFPSEVVEFWIKDPYTAKNTASIIRFLVIGAALNALMSPTFALQTSHGLTHLAFKIVLTFFITMIPITIWASINYGAIGVAGVWAGLNLIYVIIGVPLTHSFLLLGETAKWYTEDIFPPLSGICIVYLGAWVLLTQQTLHIELMVFLLLIFIIASIVGALSASQIRSRIRHYSRAG